MSSSSSSSVPRASLYRSYSRSSSTGSISSVENLPPRTIARVAKEVRDLMKAPPGGITLVVDPETGMPSSLGEIVVSSCSRLQRLSLKKQNSSHSTVMRTDQMQHVLHDHGQHG